MKPQDPLPETPTKIKLTMAENALARFFPILGDGISLCGLDGENIEAFLEKAADIPPDYLRKHVQTIFLDGSALDDLSTAVVHHGATLALSAAMPGLAGAVLRRGGFYAAMRRQISYEGADKTQASGEIHATLKLFNLVARDLGPALLQRGVRMCGDHLKDFIIRQGRWLWKECTAAEMDGRSLDPEQSADRLNPEKQVL